jgi:outer membrane receptor protein involved in Fe transport
LGIHDKYEDRGWGARAGIDFVWEGQKFLIELGSRREGLKINERPEESSLESWLSFTNEINFSDRLSLLGAARVLNHNSYDNFFLPTLGLSFLPGDDYEIYSSFFRRVTCPNLYDLYWPPESYSGGLDLLGVYDYAELGNPDLRPQVWWAEDCGFRFAKERFDLSWYLLYAQIDDLIVWSNQGSTFEVIHKPVNTFATLWGTSISGNLKPRRDLHLHLAYTYKSLKTDEIPSPEVTPLHTILGWAEVERSFFGGDLKLKGRMEGRYSSDRYLLGFREIYQPSVFVLRYSLEFQYLDFCFYYSSENVTNEEYLTWGYNPMPLRTNWWGIRWDFRD